jgi:hypothetical protein
MRVLAVIAAGFALLASRELRAQQQVDAGHRNSLSLFVGAAASSQRHETAIVVGPSYRFRVTRHIAVGPVLEMIGYRSETSTLALAGLFVKPYRGIELTLAPGVEWITGTAEAEASIVERGELTCRFALGYQTQIRRGYWMSPAAAVNLGSGAATATYGLAVGMSF